MTFVIGMRGHALILNSVEQRSDDTGKVRLLAVDDDSDAAELISRVATKCGYDVRSLTDSRTIGQVLSDWKPHVITLDLCMPEVDGMQILSLLQNNGFAGHLVIISAQADSIRAAAQRLAEGRGLRVESNVSKPIDLKALSGLLASLYRVAEGSYQDRTTDL